MDFLTNPPLSTMFDLNNNISCNNYDQVCFDSNVPFTQNSTTAFGRHTFPTPSIVDKIYSPSSNYNEEFVSVKSCAHVSYIVGKQGKKIREIRNLTETYIETPVNGEEPVFIIRGSQKNIASAREMILKSEKEYDQELYQETQISTIGETMRFNLYLPPRYIGLVVGRQGYFVKKIMDNCNVIIITPKINTINLFKITGTKSNVYLAVDQIKKHIEETTDSFVTPIPKNDREILLQVYDFNLK